MYNVTIQETLAKTVQVNADSQQNAESIARSLYCNCDVVLSADDFVCTTFKVKK